MTKSYSRPLYLFRFGSLLLTVSKRCFSVFSHDGRESALREQRAEKRDRRPNAPISRFTVPLVALKLLSFACCNRSLLPSGGLCSFQEPRCLATRTCPILTGWLASFSTFFLLFFFFLSDPLELCLILLKIQRGSTSEIEQKGQKSAAPAKLIASGRGCFLTALVPACRIGQNRNQHV